MPSAAHEPVSYHLRSKPPHAFAFHLNASLSPVRLGWSALSGLCTRCANCGLTPIGAEISISLSALALTGRRGPTLCLPDFLPMKPPQSFFFVQSVAREYLLVGEIGSALWYGGEAVTLGDLAW